MQLLQPLVRTKLELQKGSSQNWHNGNDTCLAGTARAHVGIQKTDFASSPRLPGHTVAFLACGKLQLAELGACNSNFRPPVTETWQVGVVQNFGAVIG
eukprot:6230162-Amphidinium_carterae.1